MLINAVALVAFSLFGPVVWSVVAVMAVAYLALDHRQVDMTGRTPEGAGVELPGYRRQLDPRDLSHLDHGAVCYPGKRR